MVFQIKFQVVTEIDVGAGSPTGTIRGKGSISRTTREAHSEVETSARGAEANTGARTEANIKAGEVTNNRNGTSI